MIRAALLPAAALAATPALAAFGAIAYAPDSGAWGVGEAAARGAAAEEARRVCAGFGGACVDAIAFEGACGALARASAPAIWGAASADALDDAEAAALAACGRRGPGCEIEVSLCARR